MERKEGILKKFKKYLRLFDFFGESFTFRYKDENKQTTILGGIICILFYVIAIIYFVYKFIPFKNKKIFTLQYYTINLDSTEDLYTEEYSFAFGFGLTVNNKNNNPDIMKYLDIKFEFVNKTKSNKANKAIKYYKCEEENFPPYVRKSFNDLKINELECVDLKNLSSFSHIPKGIYTDDEFFYYIISVQLKDNINEEVEDYSLYMGENRTKYYNASDRSTYAKIYIRADNRKVEVKIRYQDFMEFYADVSSLLLSIFWILGVIFAFYDRIKANHSISKKLFYF